MRRHVLIVEDSLDSRDLLKMYLEAHGFRVDCALNGEEALSILGKSEATPNYILLDANMPVMDGFEFRKHQLQDARLQGIPVIVMSGEEDATIAARMAAPFAILRKPLQLAQLLAALSP